MLLSLKQHTSSLFWNMKGLLFVSSGAVIDGTLVAGYVASQGGQASLNGLALASHTSLPDAKLQEASFLGICSVASLKAVHSDTLINLLYRLLQPGGTLSIQQTAQVQAQQVLGRPVALSCCEWSGLNLTVTLQDKEQLSRQLLFQGFGDIQPALPLQNGSHAVSGTGLGTEHICQQGPAVWCSRVPHPALTARHAFSLHTHAHTHTHSVPVDQRPACAQLMAKRPEWNVGAKSKLSLRSKAKQQSMAVDPAPPSSGQTAEAQAAKGAHSWQRKTSSLSCSRTG